MNKYLLKIILCFTLLIISILSSGCATKYRNIKPQEFTTYNNLMFDKGLEFSYDYNPLTINYHNNKNERKLKNNGIKLIAVKFKNHSSESINIENDLEYYSGNNLIAPIPMNIVKQKAKQLVPGYIPYLGFTFLTAINANTLQVYQIGYILGPLLTIFNMGKAINSNNKLTEELDKYDILKKDIKPNEVMYGLMAFKTSNYETISVKRKMEEQHIFITPR